MKPVYKILLSSIVITVILVSSIPIPVKSEVALVILPNHSLQFVSTGARLVGEVKNDGGRPVTDITITATLRDEEGKLIDVQNVTLQSNMHWLFGRYIPLDSNLHFVLKPAMTIPFRINIEEETSPKIKAYELSVTGRETAMEKPSSLIVIESNSVINNRVDNDIEWKVIGQIKNEGTQAVHNVTLLASLFNTDNLIVGVAGYTFVDKPILEIKSGETIAFGLEPVAIPKQQEIGRVNIYAESLEYSMMSENIPEVKPEIPTEKISSTNMQIVDQLGSRINDISVGQQVVLQSSVKNNVDIDQKFAYIMQIKDSDNLTIMIAWINGEIPTGKTFDIGLSWIPDNSGTYKVDVFVWESVGNPIPLSFKPLSTTITVG